MGDTQKLPFKEACSFVSYEMGESRLTGRKMVRNTSSTQFVISPNWTKSASDIAVRHWISMHESLAANVQMTSRIQKYIPALIDASDRESFGKALHKIIIDGYWANKDNSVDRRAKARLTELCIGLWSSGQLLWPTKQFVPFSHANINIGCWGLGEAEPVINQILNLSEVSSEKANRNRFIFITRLLFTGSPPAKVGDIDPSIFRIDDDERDMTKMSASRVFGSIARLQKEDHPNAIPFKPVDFGWLKGAPIQSRQAKDFMWAVVKEPEMEAWRKLTEEFLMTFTGGWVNHMLGLNFWLDYLIANKQYSRDPIAFLDGRNQASYPKFTSDETKIDQKRLVLVHDLLQFILLKHCSAVDDVGIPHVLPNFKNPIVRPIRKNANKTETHREPMPTRFVNLCLSILTEDNFAWAKSTFPSDTVKWKNTENGLFEDVWSPIRSWFLVLKLLLPARNHQIRMLDSGEGDTLCYRPNLGGWVPNQGVHAPAKVSGRRKSIQNGVFRKYLRKDGSEGSLLYFNTNKTADIDTDPTNLGYVMPWENQAAIDVLLSVRDWQERYNPIVRPIGWDELPEFKLKKPEEYLKAKGKAYFLFRDPSDVVSPEYPLRDARIRFMWVKLLEELEKRLAAAGDTLPNGEPHKLIATRSESGAPVAAIFDLHSLRVTMISALYEQGVKPEVIMKIVGHASVLMTLYYTKISPQAITDTLNEAVIKRSQSEQTQWIGYLQKQSREQLKTLAATTHDTALDAFSSAAGSGIVVMDHGFCPMGARRCSDGLVVPSDTVGGPPSFGPVPGGASNCVRCRFFMTGPAFLIGMEAHVNDLAYRLRSKSHGYEKAQLVFDELSEERTVAFHSGEPFKKARELQVAESAYEKSTAEVDGIALSLQSAYNLVEKSLAVMDGRSESESGNFALVVSSSGKVDALLEETHAFEQLQRLCVSADLFESLQIDSQQANLERMRFFDRMLARSGIEPKFCLIEDEAKAKLIANEMGKFLYARLAKRDVAMLMDGKTTLKALGLDKDIHMKLSNLEKVAPEVKILNDLSVSNLNQKDKRNGKK